MSSNKTIIFVCTSNTCRSPIAEHLARQWLNQNDLHNFSVISRALTDAYEPPGSPASENGVVVMKEDYNIDMSSHRSCLLTQADVNAADAIVGVTRSHVNYISENFSVSSDKLYSMNKDVSDPWHAPLEVYKRCAAQLSELIPSVVAHVVQQINTE